MHRLLYISTARVPLTLHQRATLLRISRRNNADNGITGMLLVGGRRFLQALEGPRAAVDTTFERIHADPRHFAIVQLASQPITERGFARWSMGFQSGGETPDGGTVAEQIAVILAPVTDPTLRAYFTGFAETHLVN